MAEQRVIRRQFDTAFKRRIVKQLRTRTVAEICEKHDIWESTVRNWAKNPSFGGSPTYKAVSARSKANGRDDSALLPTKTKSSSKSSKEDCELCHRRNTAICGATASTTAAAQLQKHELAIVDGED